MAWRRDEIWFDADVGWLREVSGGRESVSALQMPLFFRLAADVPLEIPNGLAASRQRRAELRRRRNARRARAAALVIAPAALLPVAGQKLGVGSAGGGALPEDPPSLVRDPTVVGSGPADPPVPRRATPARSTRGAEPAQRPQIHWREATSRGLWYGGSLAGGTQLPVEGPDWVTWNPNTDSVPNARRRLFGNERTIRTVVSVIEAYRAANPSAPRVVVGDISFDDGGPMDAHVSHQNGLDVDVYYPRRDGVLRAPRSPDAIDRRLAQDLLDRFLAAGAHMVFVGYQTGLRGPSRIVVPYPNHENHMHVRFPARAG
jgi:hypothetical protein